MFSLNYLEVTLTTTEDMSESLADLLWELGAGGVVVEDPRAIRAHIESLSWDAWEIPQEMIDAEDIILKGYFPVDHRLVETMARLKKRTEEIQCHFPESRLSITETEVAAENWATSWKAFYKPEKIGAQVVIKPSWEPYEAGPEDLIIEMDPGMAFGTGNHPTTAMCIRALEDYVFPGARVFDIGTGSGVLSVTAAKLGASRVIAVDHDPVSIDAARENIALNGVGHIALVRQGDLASGLEEKADVIVANIIADVIIRLIPQTLTLLQPQGIFIASGIIRERQSDVEKAFLQARYVVEKTADEGEWVLMAARRG